MRYTSLVVVALVGPLSLSILVGCRMACRLTARLQTKVRAVRGDPVPPIADSYSHNDQPGPRGGSPGKRALPRAPNSRGPQWDTPTGTQACPCGWHGVPKGRYKQDKEQSQAPGIQPSTFSSLGAALGRGFSQFGEDFCSDLPVLPRPPSLNPQVIPAGNKQKGFFLCKADGNPTCRAPVGRCNAKCPPKRASTWGHRAHLFPRVTPANLIKSLMQGVMRTGGSSLSPASS